VSLDAPSNISRRSAIARAGSLALVTGVRLPAARDREQLSDDEIERMMRVANVPSMSYAHVDGDRVTTKAIGVRRTGEADRVTPETVYAAASLTKAVFAYTFHSLVLDGVVALDRPVAEFLPLPNPDDERARHITARHLLSHSGGWRNWRNTATQPLTADFEPGSRWSYSGEGFFFLQRVVEKLTGKSVSVLAREQVFQPQGMTRSSLSQLAELEPYQATGHNFRGEVTPAFGRPTQLELRRRMADRGVSLEAATVEDEEAAMKSAEPMLPVLPNYLSPNAAASLLTTATDFGRFLAHLTSARQRGGRAASIVEQMMTPAVRCNELIQWGLGVGLEDMNGHRVAWQWGDNPGFKNFFVADPQAGEAMVVFTNGDRGARVYERVIRAVAGVDHPAFLFA